MQKKRIEIKIIKPKDGDGIAHYKEGVFFDGESYVGYSASCNFTHYGLSENKEKLNAFLSWENGRSNRFIKEALEMIDNYFNERDGDVTYLLVDQIEVAIKDKFGHKTIDELIVQEADLLKKKMSLFENKKLQKTIFKLNNDIDVIRKNPKFPYSGKPRDYQNEAYENWVNNNFSGVFAMATGTGKTITSLNCILNEYKKTNSYKAIILVPTLVLVEQWASEARDFNFMNIIAVSSKNANWKQTLTELKTKESFGIITSYIIIATYKSFANDKFQEYINSLNEDEIFIADEAHNIGSGNVKSKLTLLKIKRRIALSATPKRAYDPQGTREIEEFFNDAEPTLIISQWKEQLMNAFLCKYYYFPTLVTLQEDEMQDYNEISSKIAKIFQKASQDDSIKKQYENLLMLRKAIIHKAKNKFDAFKDIVATIMKSETGLKYTLVYAPEGYHSDDEFIEEEFPELDNESRIIDLLFKYSEKYFTQYSHCPVYK